MSVLAYGVAAWLILAGCFGIVRSRHLVRSVVCLSVVTSGTYVLLLAVGFQRGGAPPVFPSRPRSLAGVVDPVVQALTLTDIVVSATVTALLLALTIQVHATVGTVDPDALSDLRG